jgi:hypothetical protein
MAVTTQRVISSDGDFATSFFQASPVDAAFFIAPFDLTIKQVQEVHGTAGSDGGAVTLQVERLQGTEAAGGNGDSLLASTVNMKGTANTVVVPGLTTTTAHLTLSKGDRLGLNYTGTLTALANVAITVKYQKA